VEQLEEGEYQIIVADQGPGIAEEYATRVFDPFFQIDGSPTRSQGGTGVGLAVARGVARGHGGDLTLVSPCNEEIDGVPFHGAAFCFALSKKPRVRVAPV
jgi:signal transduction histidine kinase